VSTLAEQLVKQVRKEFGEKAAFLAKDIPNRSGVSSGSIALDYAIGPLGGMPRDHCVEFFGPESSGKSTLGLMCVANNLDFHTERGALILDTEHKMTEERLTQLLGPERMKRVVVAYPDHIEHAHDMYTALVPSGDIGVVMLDSIGGAPVKKATEDSAEKANFGNAKAVTAFARMAGGHSHKYECLTIGINQLRENLDPRSHALITPGGKGWKHACMLRVYLRKGKGRVSMVMGNDTVDVGYTVAGRIHKNHLGGIEGREFTYWFYNAPYQGKTIGVDQAEEVERLSTATGVVTRNGGWYVHEGLPDGKVNGKERFTEALNANPALRATLAEATLAALRNDSVISLEGEETIGPIREKDVDEDR